MKKIIIILLGIVLLSSCATFDTDANYEEFSKCKKVATMGFGGGLVASVSPLAPYFFAVGAAGAICMAGSELLSD